MGAYVSGTSSRSKRRYSGPVIVLEKTVFTSPEYARLSPAAAKILLCIHLSYSSRNNGRLSFTAQEAERAGFRSKSVVQKARDELLHSGWLMIAKQGGKHSPTLYALTWVSIDPIDHIDIKPGPAPHLWRDQNAHLREIRGGTPQASRRGFARRKSCPATRDTLPRDTGRIAPRHGATT